MPATNLMNQGYTPFGCPRSQNKEPGKRENGKRTEAEKEGLEEKGRLLTFSPLPPHIKRHKIR